MAAQSHHKKESPATTSNTLPTETTATFSPVTESSSDDEESSSLSSQNDVKQTLLKVTPRQLSFPNKAGSSQPAAVITAPTAAVGIATKITPKEEQMEAALHLSLHNSPSLDEMDGYKHLSAAGEHFARKKSEGEHISLFSRLANKVGGSIGHHAHDDGYEEVRDELQEDEGQQVVAGGQLNGHQVETTAVEKGVVNDDTKQLEEEEAAVSNRPSNEEEEADQPYRHLSAAGEHFAMKKAEKKAAAAAAAKKRAEKTKSSTTTAAPVDHSTADIDDNNDDDEEENDRYRHLSAAGEHFARKKSENGGSPMLKSVLSRMTPSFRQLHSSEDGDSNDDEDEAPVRNLSAAGEHFAKKKAEKKSERAAKKVEKEDQSVEVGEEEDPFQHLSSAGEHFARKKAEKKARRASKEEVLAAELSNEDGEEEIDDETDRYKHLSSAGEHFARKKSDRESTSLFSRLRSSFTSQSNSTTEERDEEEEDRFKHLSSAGEHFARKKAEKKAKKKGRGVSKRENPTKREEEEEEEETEDPSSIVSVHSSQGTDTSNEEKLCDDHDADSLDLVVVVQHLGDGDNETTLTAEKDGESLEEDAENETRNLVTNTTASTISAAQSKLDEIQRTPAYTLHRDLVIGKGSYGHVYIASRGETEGHFSSKPGKRKKFACKCVSLPADPKYICKLQEEVNVLRVLRGHVNVIRLFDVFVLDNELLIITELGTGGDLLHLLATHPKHGVSEEYAAKTVSDMLSAVAILHSLHICHRDLKIENWVLKSGNDLWSPLKLIDFGLSTHFTPGHKLSRVVGSSYYIAPEVLKKSYTEACDLWSLGVIVYMLLSGAPPFFGSSEELIKESILNGEYSFPQELFRDVSKDAMAFVSCLLSYDEEERYTAHQALHHPWLEAKCKPEHLLRCKAGARVAEE